MAFRKEVIANVGEFSTYLRSNRQQRDAPRALKWLDSIVKGDSAPSANRFQNPRLYYPGLTDVGWHDQNRVSFCLKLQEHAPRIAAEYFGRSDRDPATPYTQNDAQFITGTEWRAAILKRWYFNDEEAHRYPVTTALLRDPDVAETAMFSVLQGGGKILPHCAPWNTRLTVHLGLKVPAGCEIRVCDEIRTWKEGEALAFDDSFEHEVWNNSSESRAILLVDVWHPELSEAERIILEPTLKLLDDDYNSRFTVHDAITSVRNAGRISRSMPG
ncbi:aspartyl/asparaginyl beta-hydroxylase domain-containing protein [Burkholderia cenocepacia]|uniref:aspartyl/asparaginyl beta-hydroxylase domain-containing protein n=1 Tax=Burkholderia cenocepacia TaxID=95486 RepID=UPI002AB64572|nr:aspartyl/asparaginyl beta-hydroxylase domain-containing protein [Burkholderia cenocepacia]